MSTKILKKFLIFLKFFLNNIFISITKLIISTYKEKIIATTKLLWFLRDCWFFEMKQSSIIWELLIIIWKEFGRLSNYLLNFVLFYFYKNIITLFVIKINIFFYFFLYLFLHSLVCNFYLFFVKTYSYFVIVFYLFVLHCYWVIFFIYLF